MSDKSLFIYDGECPFCNHFAQLLELKCNLSNLEILDGRENLALLTKLYNKAMIWTKEQFFWEIKISFMVQMLLIGFAQRSKSQATPF